jgi:hypothetical protein
MCPDIVGGAPLTRMTTKIFSDDQLRDKDIDTLKRYLRPKLGGYRVAWQTSELTTCCTVACRGIGG